MKEIRMICVILALFTMICFAGGALGAGIEPPNGYDPAADCECLFERGQPDVIIKGPYQKGTFTISNGPENGLAYDVFITHMFLRWRNTVFLRSAINFSGDTDSICHLSDDQIAQAIVQYPLACYIATEETFDLEGTPVVKDVVITDRSCDTSIYSDIVRGEITIGVIPTSLVYNGDECVLPLPPTE